MKYFIVPIVIFSCISVLGIQCIDPISLNIDNAQPTIIVDGQITDSMEMHTIRIHKSAIIGQGNDNILEPIAGASVVVSDNRENKFTFIESLPGIYTSLFKGIKGLSYRIEIKLKDGHIIKSTPQILKSAPPVGQINTEVKVESFRNSAGNISLDTRLILKMNTDLANFPGDQFLRWKVDGEFEFVENYPMALRTKVCYVKDNVGLNNLKIFDSRILSDKKLVDEPFINTALDYRFATQYCFHIQQYGMSEHEYSYWSAVRSVTNIDGSLFDAPPGTVRGNLFSENNPNEIIVGYFSVNGVQSTRFFANPQSLNQIDIAPKCRTRFNASPTQDCLNCLTINGATILKPSYWKP